MNQFKPVDLNLQDTFHTCLYTPQRLIRDKFVSTDVLPKAVATHIRNSSPDMDSKTTRTGKLK